MGCGSDNDTIGRTFAWNEIADTEPQKLKSKDDKKLIVIHGLVYDITEFSKRHPGGAKLISAYSGQDATVELIIYKILCLLLLNFFACICTLVHHKCYHYSAQT